MQGDEENIANKSLTGLVKGRKAAPNQKQKLRKQKTEMGLRDYRATGPHIQKLKGCPVK
jgi:hypothetical protein